MLKKHSARFQEGFTLIEMAIVIVVIGILMGIVFQGVRGVQKNARDTRRLADLRRVQTHLELYFQKCGHYPTAGNCGAGGGGGAASSLTWTELTNKLSEVVNASEIPKDPRNDQSYVYYFGDGGFDYVLAAHMENLGTNREVTGAFGELQCDTLYCIRD
ncbi:MAG: prepilin-type N-terminal cleavage/methylation domain-containing protein [Parcubacteria group bacterium]